MDEPTPLQNFLAFLRLVFALMLIIVGGVALVLGLVWYLGSDERPMIEQGNFQVLPAYEPEPIAAEEETLPPEISAAQSEYEATKRELEAALAQSEGAPPVFQEQIGIVEGAVMEIVSALALSPSDRQLHTALLRAHDRELDLLQKALQTAEPADDPTTRD